MVTFGPKRTNKVPAFFNKTEGGRRDLILKHKKVAPKTSATPLHAPVRTINLWRFSAMYSRPPQEKAPNNAEALNLAVMDCSAI